MESGRERAGRMIYLTEFHHLFPFLEPALPGGFGMTVGNTEQLVLKSPHHLHARILPCFFIQVFVYSLHLFIQGKNLILQFPAYRTGNSIPGNIPFVSLSWKYVKHILSQFVHQFRHFHIFFILAFQYRNRLCICGINLQTILSSLCNKRTQITLSPQEQAYLFVPVTGKCKTERAVRIQPQGVLCLRIKHSVNGFLIHNGSTGQILYRTSNLNFIWMTAWSQDAPEKTQWQK